MPDLPENPFFIIGHPRSGTTLLRFILSSHPRLLIPAETGFLPFLKKSPKAMLTIAEVEQVLNRISILNTEWAELVPDLKKFYAALPEPRLVFILDALYRIKVGSFEAARWGDKTPGYVNHLPALQRIFPQAQFLHIVRDGRDAVLSATKKWGDANWYMDEYYLLKGWVRSVKAGRAFGAEVPPHNYHEVHYEDLVQSPRETLKSICHFLTEEFHPAMLDHSTLAQEMVGTGGHVEVLRPVHTSSVGRWQHEMSTFGQKLSDQIAGTTLAAFGYPLADLQKPTPIEKSRIAVLAIKFQLIDALRSLLAASGWLTLNKGKRQRKKWESIDKQA